MQLLQVGSEVVDALGVKELANDIGGLQVADGCHVLRHGPIKIPLGMQVIPIPLLYPCHHPLLCLHSPPMSCL